MKRKKYICFVFVIFLLVACSIRQVEILKHDYFEKSMYSFFDFEDNEKENINSFLDDFYVETDNLCGFSKYESRYDLNLINSCLELSLNCNDYFSYEKLYKLVFEKIKKINANQIENGYDLYCYLSLINNYNLPITDDFYDLLEHYFDNDDNLFFYYGKNDLEEIKISMSINFYLLLKENDYFLSKYSEKLKCKIEEIYNNFEFLKPEDNNSLYNSGGRILIASNVILEKKDFNDKIEWFNCWKNSINSIDDLLSASNYCDFLEVMSLFEDISYYKIDNFLRKIDKIDLENDLQCLKKISNYINITQYNFYFNMNLNGYISDIQLIRDNIDIENTYYGFLLSKMTNFNIEYDKMKRLISTYYKLISQEKAIDKLSHFIYYTVGLDICLNDTFTGNLEMITNKLNYILDSEARSVDIRKCIETISAISIFKPIVITNNNLINIADQINKILEDKNNLNNSLISDLLIIDFELSGLLNIDVLNELKDNLYYNGGFKNNDHSNEADMFSTYSIYKLNIETSDNKFILDNVSFVHSLKVDEGIYSYSLTNSTINLKTIWYGNIISKTKVGNYDGIKN